MMSSEASIYDLKMDDKGILRLHVSDKRNETVEDLKKLFFDVGVLTKGKKAPVLITYDAFVYSSPEVNEYWSNASTACAYFSAEAFIANTIGQELTGGYYLAKHASERPVQMFSNETEALEWLIKFLN